MAPVEIGILAVALAIDAFSVAMAVGPRCCPRFGAYRLAGSFGLFQAAMPLLGAFMGSVLYEYVEAYDHWVAFGLLAGGGSKMIVDAFWRRHTHEGDDPEGGARLDPSCGLSLMGLSVATSIDALGAGLVLGMLKTNLWVACAVIGLVAAVLTYLGARLGAKIGHRVGGKAEAAGGIVLIALGVRMLLMP